MKTFYATLVFIFSIAKTDAAIDVYCTCGDTVVPDKPADIHGQTTGVCGIGASYTYKCPSAAHASEYYWRVPPGATITSGQGSRMMSVRMPVGFKIGRITVRAFNCFGGSEEQSLIVHGIPPKPGPISGPSSVCANQTGVHYSIDSVTGASAYTWLLPPGATLTSGGQTTSITVNFGESGGTIQVRSSSACGGSRFTSLAVTIDCRAGEVTSNLPHQSSQLTIYPNPVHAQIQIDCPGFEGSTQLYVVNVFGQQVIGATINLNETATSRLDLSDLIPCIYEIIVTGESRREAGYFVKE